MSPEKAMLNANLLGKLLLFPFVDSKNRLRFFYDDDNDC